MFPLTWDTESSQIPRDRKRSRGNQGLKWGNYCSTGTEFVVQGETNIAQSEHISHTDLNT